MIIARIERDDHERGVVLQRVTTPVPYGGGDPVDEIGGRRGGMLRDRGEESRVAELLVTGRGGLGDAVGEAHEAITWRGVEPPRGVRPVGADTEDGAGRHQPIDA